MARVHAHPRLMGPKMDSILYGVFGSLLRNRFVSRLWIRQTDTQGRGSPFRHARSLINNACFPASSPFFSLLPRPTAAFSTIMAKQKATAEEREARAESNGYRRGPTERNTALET